MERKVRVCDGYWTVNSILIGMCLKVDRDLYALLYSTCSAALYISGVRAYPRCLIIVPAHLSFDAQSEPISTQILGARFKAPSNHLLQ